LSFTAGNAGIAEILLMNLTLSWLRIAKERSKMHKSLQKPYKNSQKPYRNSYFDGEFYYFFAVSLKKQSQFDRQDTDFKAL